MSDLKAAVKKVIGFVTDATIEAAYRKILDAMHGQSEIITAIELERKGGRCPLCNMPFIRIDVDNRFGKFHFYEPQCHCYKRCKICERDIKTKKFLIAERFLNITYCTDCFPNGPYIPEKKREPKRRDYREATDAAAGD